MVWPDHRGQQGGLGDQRLDRGGIGMLRKHRVEHAVKPDHPAADVRPVKLKGQHHVIPGDLFGKRHARRVSSWVRPS
jgi:hypothetical protein